MIVSTTLRGREGVGEGLLYHVVCKYLLLTTLLCAVNLLFDNENRGILDMWLLH